MHGDFTPWNLRQSGRTLYLVDWEQAGWGPPDADEVLYRMTAAALHIGAGRRGWAPGAGSAEAVRYWADRADRQWHGSVRDDRFVAATQRVLQALEGGARTQLRERAEPPAAGRR
jgi:aminoglycoside phosphotransferase (APT) family kinase protein